MKISSTLLWTLLAVSLQAQAPSVRDSAGIRIVMNPALAAAKETFTFHPQAMYDVGGLDEDPAKEFDSRQGYLRGVFLSDGGFAVIDVSRLQFFNDHAKRVGILGTKGAGPEDFAYLNGICRTRGDTVVVYDSRNHRTAVISPAKKVVRTVPATANGGITSSSCFDDGTVVLSRSDFDAAARTSTTRYVRARLDGTVVNPLLTAPPERPNLLTSWANAIATGGQRFYLGLPDATQITAYGPTGALVLMIRYADKGEKITDADALKRTGYAMPMGGAVNEAAVAAAKATAVAQWKSGPHTEYWPSHGQIHVDDQGRLWVNQNTKDSNMPGVPGVWVAFAADGKMIGKLVVPADKHVVGFARNGVLVYARDSDGAAHLELHSIAK